VLNDVVLVVLSLAVRFSKNLTVTIQYNLRLFRLDRTQAVNCKCLMCLCDM